MALALATDPSAIRRRVLMEVTSGLCRPCHLPELCSLVVDYAVDMDLLHLNERVNKCVSTARPLKTWISLLSCFHCAGAITLALQSAQTVWSGWPLNMDAVVLCSACHKGAKPTVVRPCCDVIYPINMRTGLLDRSESASLLPSADLRRFLPLDVKRQLLRPFKHLLLTVGPVKLTIPALMNSSEILKSLWFEKLDKCDRLGSINGQRVGGWRPTNSMVIATPEFQNIYEWMPMDHDAPAELYALVNCTESSNLYRQVALAYIDVYGLHVQLARCDVDAYVGNKRKFEKNGRKIIGIACDSCHSHASQGAKRWSGQRSLCHTCYQQRASTPDYYHDFDFIDLLHAHTQS